MCKKTQGSQPDWDTFSNLWTAVNHYELKSGIQYFCLTMYVYSYPFKNLTDSYTFFGELILHWCDCYKTKCILSLTHSNNKEDNKAGIIEEEIMAQTTASHREDNGDWSGKNNRTSMPKILVLSYPKTLIHSCSLSSLWHTMPEELPCSYCDALWKYSKENWN